MTTSDAVTISSLATPSEALAFRVINEEWISTLFAFTDEDRRVRNDPLTQIVAPEGDVRLASLDEGETVGCSAPLPHGDGVFELAKIGVTPQRQGNLPVADYYARRHPRAVPAAQASSATTSPSERMACSNSGPRHRAAPWSTRPTWSAIAAGSALTAALRLPAARGESTFHQQLPLLGPSIRTSYQRSSRR